MKLTCKKCKTSIEIPSEATRAPDHRVVCPKCGARYRLRSRETRRPAAAASQMPPGQPISSTWTPATPLPTGVGTGHPELEGRTRNLATGEVEAGSAALSGGGSAPIGGSVLPPAPVAFSAGQVLAGRYRIIRFLAQGGMGEVYEAEDLELRQRLALKTISSSSTDQTAIDRFKREIALARVVTHPNVCRIFDLGQHTPEPGAAGSTPPKITFLTMELLQGETLTARLRRGPLSLDEALPLVRQMAAALDAAHGAGVVHRDFKSENVFLVPSDDGTRAVVTDFGVARGTAATDGFASQVTGAGIVGTPAYMAPEQIEDDPVTQAADIFAFGVVIYEMVTGRLPYESDNPLTSAVKRLQEPPTPPRVYLPSLHPAWERTILRCLERLPEKRFGSAGEAGEALPEPAENLHEALPATIVGKRPLSGPDRPSAAAGRRSGDGAVFAAPAPSRPAAQADGSRRIRLLTAALLAVGVLSAALFWFNRARRDNDRFTPRRSVAVLSLLNQTGDPEVAWLATAVAEMLTTELARGETLRTIPGDNAARAQRQLGIEAGSVPPAELLANLRSLLGCDYLVLGSYTRVDADADIRLDIRLQDAALGTHLASFSEHGGKSELFAMVTRLGDRLRQELGAAGAGTDDPLAGTPIDPVAARLYSEALDDLRDSRPEQARELLQRAASAEPRNPLIHSALSTAWQAQGYPERAKEAAQRAFQLSSHLSREDRLVVEGRFRETEGDYAAAAEIYATLYEYFPDDLEYGLRLAAVANEGRQPRRALQVLDQLRSLPAPLSEDPRIDLATATAAGLSADFGRQLEAAARAAARAEQLGASLLVAQAKLAQSQAHRFLGQPRQAEAAALAAHEIFAEINNPAAAALALTAAANALVDRSELDEAAGRFRQAIDGNRRIGNRGGVASGLNNLALVLKKKGDLDQARELYEQAEEIFRATDDHLGLANTLNNLGVLLVHRDQLAEAHRRFEDSREIWDEIGEPSQLAYSLNNVAAVLHLQGRLWESRAMHERALEIRREMGQKITEVTSLTNLGRVLTDLGELETAGPRLDQALALASEIGDRSAEAEALFALGELRLAEGEAAEARRLHQKALDIRTDLEAKHEITVSRIALARVARVAGDAATAAAVAETAAGVCRREQRSSDEAVSRAILARALAADGKLAEARREIDIALELAAASERSAVELEVELAAAHVRDASGQPVAAWRQLQELEIRAEELGYVSLRLEAMLAWAESKQRAGGVDEAREKLETVRAEAAVRGFSRFEQEATEALN
ncbi:MAG: tetratricopeptide repeat protein [Thermoanaerobaculia bacterium]